MEVTQYQYLRLNKFLMYVQGLWPHQKTSEKILVSIVFLPIIASQTVLQVGGLVTSWNDPEAFMEIFASFIINLLCLTKFFNFAYYNKEMKDLLVIMEEDWTLFLNSNRESDIMRQCYDVGRKVTLAYAGSLYGLMVPYMAVPTVVRVLSALSAENASKEKALIFRVDNFVDIDTYYYPILIHSYVSILAFVTIAVGVDTMIMFYVQHECGICQVLGYRLENFVEDDDAEIELYPKKEEDVGYKNVRDCVLLHKHIIDLAPGTLRFGYFAQHYHDIRRYARRLDNANTVSFLLQLGFNMVAITFTAFQMATNLDKPNELLRYACFTLCVTFVLFLESWPGQQITDYTDRITEYITNAKWYRASMSSRKIIHVMLMRGFIPIKLTAGRVFTLNLENFSSVVRTSFSYFTVLCSMQ